MRHYFRKQSLIIIGLIIFILICVSLQSFLTKKLEHKNNLSEPEQELYTEELHKKLSTLNHQISLLKEENSTIQILNHDLISKLENIKNTDHDPDTYNNVKDNELNKKLQHLEKENSNLNNLVLELKQQISKSQVNSYSLFQAGKLELELSSLNQRIDEQSENMNLKNKEIIKLKEKCENSKNNSKICKEYSLHLELSNVLQKQIDHFTEQRDDLKKRINIYLSHSVKSNFKD